MALRVKALREAAGLSRADLAARAGLHTVSQIGDLENGRIDNPGLRNAARVARALSAALTQTRGAPVVIHAEDLLADAEWEAPP